MPTTVTRSFSDQAAAQAAADDLKRQGFADSAIRLVPGDGGGAVVSVLAEFGEGQRATRTLEAHGPVSTVPAPARHAHNGHHAHHGAHAAETPSPEAAPLSTALGLPLLSHKPAPFSSWLGLPLLSASQSPSVNLSSNQPAPLSSALGLPLLSKAPEKPANLPSNKAAPLSDAVGWPTLSKKAAPFSSWLKLPLLTKESKAPAPDHHGDEQKAA
jgi:hypothetical protein